MDILIIFTPRPRRSLSVGPCPRLGSNSNKLVAGFPGLLVTGGPLQRRELMDPALSHYQSKNSFKSSDNDNINKQSFGAKFGCVLAWKSCWVVLQRLGLKELERDQRWVRAPGSMNGSPVAAD